MVSRLSLVMIRNGTAVAAAGRPCTMHSTQPPRGMARTAAGRNPPRCGAHTMKCHRAS